jgi:type IV pilus assembly protein PilW
MRATQAPASGRSAGFSLMELMVGLAIGMIAMVTIIQVMSFFEAQRRTTSGTADAQTNGGIALYAIARDLQMAGYPLMSTTDSPLGCTTVTSHVTGLSANLSPAVITNGTAGTYPASDSITIRYGTTLSGGAPTQITSLATTPAIAVASSMGCQANDIVLIMSGGTNCSFTRASAVAGTGSTTNTVTLDNTTPAAIGNNLACFGTWNEITYAVNGATGNLERTAVVNGVSSTQPMIAGIINLQAQYGISTSAASNAITQWVDASGGTWAAPTVANRNRIKAIRIAVVARNTRRETDVVSAACTSVDSASPGGVCAWEGNSTSPAPTVNLSTNHADWNRYRYRVFETIIPLRNVIWSKDSL